MKAIRITPFALLAALLCAAAPDARGQEASPGPAVTAPTAPAAQPVREIDDWAIRCDEATEGRPRHCEMFQSVSLQETGQRLVEVAIGYPPGTDRPLAVFLLPLGILLPSGVALRVDDGAPVGFPVQLCERNGCRADLPLSDALVTAMKAGNRAVVQVQDGRGQVIGLPVSLKGFTKALAEVTKP